MPYGKGIKDFPEKLPKKKPPLTNVGGGFEQAYQDEADKDLNANRDNRKKGRR